MTAVPVVFERRPWGLVVVVGPDATSFLQSIVSPDLAPVAVGETVASLLLHPQGKLDVAFRATRHATGDDGDEWWLDTEPGVAAQLAAGLTRFKIRVKADIEDRSAIVALATVIGTRDVLPVGGLHRIETVWGDHAGVDVLGSDADVGAWVAQCGLPSGTHEELEVLRIEAGVPAQGIDVDESTIPQEAFLEVDAVSFTKGCFIGQELVCRIDSRGHVNRFLRRLALSGDAVPAHGADVTYDGKAVGGITSAVAVPGEHRVVALAMVRREVEPPAEVTVTVAGTQIPAALLL